MIYQKNLAKNGDKTVYGDDEIKFEDVFVADNDDTIHTETN